MEFFRGITRSTTTTLRVAEIFCSLIVVGCISHRCKPDGYCAFNDSGACNLGIGIGVFSFLLSFIFIGSDYISQDIGRLKRSYHTLELGLTGGTTFIWAIAFLYMATQWSRDQGPPSFLKINNWSAAVINNAQASIVFSLFQTCLWGFSLKSALARTNNGEELVLPQHDTDEPFYNDMYQSD